VHATCVVAKKQRNEFRVRNAVKRNWLSRIALSEKSV
jgi:hypothetical protein